jgi:rubrerythrin
MSVSKDELREMMRGVVREAMAAHDGTKALVEKALANQPSITEQTIQHGCECPGCYCGIIEEKNKTSDYFCNNCGLPLGDEAFAKSIEKCPNCGAKDNIRKVQR